MSSKVRGYIERIYRAIKQSKSLCKNYIVSSAAVGAARGKYLLVSLKRLETYGIQSHYIYLFSLSNISIWKIVNYL